MFWTPYGFNNSGIVWRDALTKPTHALPHQGQGAGCDHGVLVDLRGDIPGEGYAECDGKQPGENASERVGEGQPRVAALLASRQAAEQANCLAAGGRRCLVLSRPTGSYRRRGMPKLDDSSTPQPSGPYLRIAVSLNR